MLSDELIKKPTATNVSVACIQLILVVSLPIFSYKFLKKNTDFLDEDNFENSYGTLYQNMK
jgi:hypothetical protein